MPARAEASVSPSFASSAVTDDLCTSWGCAAASTSHYLRSTHADDSITGKHAKQRIVSMLAKPAASARLMPDLQHAYSGQIQM